MRAVLAYSKSGLSLATLCELVGWARKPIQHSRGTLTYKYSCYETRRILEWVQILIRKKKGHQHVFYPGPMARFVLPFLSDVKPLQLGTCT